jgi:hypothetical protein
MLRFEGFCVVWDAKTDSRALSAPGYSVQIVDAIDIGFQTHQDVDQRHRC